MSNIFKKRTKSSVLIAAILSSIIFTGCSSDKKTIQSQEILELPEVVTEETINDVLKSTPSTQETNSDSGISADNYDTYEFLGYKGQISFFYDKDGSLLYYKWFISESDEKEAANIYKDVCASMTENYGEGTPSDNAASDLYTTSWNTGKNQIVAQKVASGNGYEVSYMVVNN